MDLSCPADSRKKRATSIEIKVTPWRPGSYKGLFREAGSLLADDHDVINQTDVVELQRAAQTRGDSLVGLARRSVFGRMVVRQEDRGAIGGQANERAGQFRWSIISILTQKFRSARRDSNTMPL